MSSSDIQIAAALVGRHRAAVIAATAVLALVVAGGIYALRVRWAEPIVPSGTEMPSVADLDVTQLTTTGNASRPAISPDGKFVAYVQQDANDFSLWIRQIATSSDAKIVSAEAGIRLLGATVTPDGSFVDFVRLRERRFSLWRVPFLGGSAKQLIDDIWSPVGWSPDGQQLAFVRDNLAAGTHALILADATRNHERPLATRHLPATFMSLALSGFPAIRPAWSPNGRVIALPGSHEASGTGEIVEIVFVDVATGSEQSRSIPSTAPSGLAWRDDQSLVIAQAREAGAADQLWLMSYPDGQLSRLTNDLNQYLGVSVTADRGTLSTARTERRGRIWVGDAAGMNGADVAEGLRLSWEDKHLFAVVANAATGGFSIVRLVPERDSRTDVIAKGTIPAPTSDGRTIVYESTEESERGGIWKVGADGRQPVQLTADGAGPVLTHDDRYVVFVSARDGVQTPWMVSIDGGSPRQITDLFAGWPSLAVSPDDTSLAFWSQDAEDQRVLVTCDLPDCPSPRIFTGPSSQGRLQWTPDGRGIAYIDFTRPNLWVQPLDGAPPQQLTQLTDSPIILDFAWSSDGKRLAMARVTVTTDIVLFKGLRKQ